jgi:DNA-binding MarR family transcriptional regulator
VTDTLSRQRLGIGELPRLIGRVRRALKRRLGSDPFLPDSHVEIMRLLYDRPGMKVQEVASALLLAPNTVSTLVQQMARSGHLERTTDREDRRAARLALSPATRRRVARRRDERRSAIEEAFSSLSKGDRSAIEAALPALVRLAEALEDGS